MQKLEILQLDLQFVWISLEWDINIFSAIIDLIWSGFVKSSQMKFPDFSLTFPWHFSKTR